MSRFDTSPSIVSSLFVPVLAARFEEGDPHVWPLAQPGRHGATR
jgi:hypothetical protein